MIFCDVRGSMPDLVRAIGRALRMHPGEGKNGHAPRAALLAIGETTESMLTSPAYAGPVKLEARDTSASCGSSTRSESSGAAVSEEQRLP
ncbi:hypothetical protein [Streptomyces sp. NPDC056463]|uniref:hypothetical protein n=1 Tax=Streptomyces sp. NPDC056463 TaxID=3345827 RepID=UPI00368A0125